MFLTSECKIIKNWRSTCRFRDRVRGLIGLGIGLVVSMVFFLGPPTPPPPKKKSGKITELEKTN